MLRVESLVFRVAGTAAETTLATAGHNHTKPSARPSPSVIVDLRNMFSDTSPEAAQVQNEIFRRMTPEQRVHLALEMSESMRKIARAGLRSRRPDLTEAELSRELLGIMYGFVPPAA